MPFNKRAAPQQAAPSLATTPSKPAANAADLDFYTKNKNLLNVILFGETGVGKTTLINAFMNYLAYDSIDDAITNDLKYAIPASFSITDANYQTIVVQVGAPDVNERQEQGESATQKARSYFFDIRGPGNRALHIIDTPGIGDTKGVLKDKNNFQETIDYIKQFDGLHAICILLKPNESRFTLHYRYCFKELLVHLNKGAAPNICFCYTHAKGTFYKPGEGLPLLKALIKEVEDSSKLKIPLSYGNIFCFDSEAFRFLAAHEQGVKFEQDEVDGFKQSWDQASGSLLKLIAYATQLPVSTIKPMVLLKDARKLLLELSKPVAEISRNIQSNKKLAQDKKEELENRNFEFGDLANRLYIDQTDLEVHDLPYPKTVCSNSQCIKVLTVQGEKKINYIQECHPHCYLKNVATDTIADRHIAKCHAFNGGATETCISCGHNWREHLHIRKEYNEIKVQVIDTNIEHMINQKKTTDEIIAQAIKSADELIVQLEQEQDVIIKASAKLANFIKQNGIMYYNPDLEEYFDLLIKEEEAKKQAGANNETLIDNLRDVKDNYMAELKIFDKALTHEELVDEHGIQDIIDNLLNLSLNGKMLADFLKNK